MKYVCKMYKYLYFLDRPAYGERPAASTSVVPDPFNLSSTSNSSFSLDPYSLEVVDFIIMKASSECKYIFYYYYYFVL